MAYYHAIHRLAVAPALHGIASVKGEILRLLSDERRAQGKADRFDAGPRDQARGVIDRAGHRAAASLEPRELADVAEQFGKRTSAFQQLQLDLQVRRAMGVPLSALERPTTDRIPGFVRENVDLIKTVPERYFERIRRDVTEAFESGMHVDTLAQQIEADGDAAESDAIRIARDQVGKLAAQVNQDRQEALGVTAFIWRGVLDQRERDSHRALEGEQFDWDDPPVDEETGEPITPGSAIQCRCFAEPVLDDILTGAEN